MPEQEIRQGVPIPPGAREAILLGARMAVVMTVGAVVFTTVLALFHMRFYASRGTEWIIRDAIKTIVVVFPLCCSVGSVVGTTLGAISAKHMGTLGRSAIGALLGGIAGAIVLAAVVTFKVAIDANARWMFGPIGSVIFAGVMGAVAGIVVGAIAGGLFAVSRESIGRGIGWAILCEFPFAVWYGLFAD